MKLRAKLFKIPLDIGYFKEKKEIECTINNKKSLNVIGALLYIAREKTK